MNAATYSVADPQNTKFESDLVVLENEVAAGEPESTKLAVRLGAQFRNAADIAEYLDAILGRAIRSSPVAYLTAILGQVGCPGAIPSGDLFVDRTDARAAEARARVKALESVEITQLQKKRAECVAVLMEIV